MCINPGPTCSSWFMDLPGAKLRLARFQFSRIKRLPTNPLFEPAPLCVHACVRVCFLAVPPFCQFLTVSQSDIPWSKYEAIKCLNWVKLWETNKRASNSCLSVWLFIQVNWSSRRNSIVPPVLKLLEQAEPERSGITAVQAFSTVSLQLCEVFLCFYFVMTAQFLDRFWCHLAVCFMSITPGICLWTY